MSKVLIIRHLPNSLSFQDKQQLLKHFGAEKVWETAAKRNYTFASFASIEKAKASLIRLHQLEISKRRLVVEYSFDKELIIDNKEESEKSSKATHHVKEFLRVLNAWNPSLNFYQPPPVHLKYKYPELTTKVAMNIIHALFKTKSFYVQTVHLMNKMCLDVPFCENEESIKFFKETFREVFADEIAVTKELSDQESEISSEESEQPKQQAPTVTKRKHTLPKTRKRPAAVLSTATLPKAKKSHIDQKEVFENVTPVAEVKKISVNVPQDALQKQTEEPEVVGELGKFEKEAPPVIEEKAPEPEQPTITKRELLKNRISYSDMKILPVFKNYHPGQPSMRLYIKNLAKTVTEQDVKSIYKRYVKNLSEDEEIGFDVRVMQEGRMKGQAFVTFPSVSLAETALHETNGYMLKDRPMVVQFARAANKKSFE
ncbi:RNA-binding region-containing protein 3-like [Epargyreus clarus]|uniref:RNA-binding region-containing protein 3-like n=1 Tax=Epargyreus clarus TaxID=520877 RepID=UPI003C2E7A1A